MFKGCHIVFRKLAAAWQVPRSLEYNSWLFTASCYLATYEETCFKSIPLPSEDCRLSKEVHATIPKGVVGGFEFTVLQRNL